MEFTICLTELAGVTSYTGGVGRRYAATIPELAQMGHKITVLLVADSPIIDDPVQLNGVELVICSSLVKVPWRLRAIPRALLFRRYLRKTGAQNIYAPEWLGTCSFAPGGAKIVTNLVASLSLISEIAGEEATSKRSQLKSMLDGVQIWCEDRQIRRSIGVVACSSAILSWNSRRFATGFPRGSVVSNCINVERTRAISLVAPLPPAWPSSPGPLVLFAGRMQLIKGIDIAMTAFEEVVSRFPDARFVVAGGEGDLTIDPSLEEIRASVSPAVGERLALLGQLDEKSLYACMREASVVVCPSRWEAFGNIALEVRASGGVLIATTGSGFAESCSDLVDSLLVEPGNAEALAEAIVRVLSDPKLRQRLLDNGSRRVLDFTASTTAGTLSKRLESLWN